MKHVRGFLVALYRDHPGRARTVVVLMLAVSLTDAIGVLLLVPLLAIVGVDVDQGSVGRIGETVSATLAALGIPVSLLPVLGGYVLLISFKHALRVWETTAVTRLEQGFARGLRERLYRATMAVPWVQFTRNRRSDLMHLLTTELDRVGSAASLAPRLLSQLLLVGMYVGLAAIISPTLTAVATASGLVLMLGARRWNQRTANRGETASGLGAELQAEATESLRGLKTVRSYGAEQRSIERFSRLSRRVADNWVGTMRDYAVVSALFGVGTAVILGAVVFVSIDVLALPTATILLSLYLFAKLAPRFSALQTGYQYLLNAVPAYAGVMQGIEAYEDHAEPDASRVPIELRQEVVFDDVQFAYPNSEESPALRGFSMRIRAGETVALVGRSGAGKSTIADLLLGLLEPQAGRILIDGHALMPEDAWSWRSRIGFVPQRTFLIHDTIRANLEWARPGASEQALWKALRLAAAEELVRGLPNGLDTVVGDDGVLLSGGEQQRLSLARALLREPDLLILDEPASALDLENERRVLDAIQALEGGVATLLITHRLETARLADRIYVLDQGRLVEEGPWTDLVERQGLLYELWTSEPKSLRGVA